MDLVQERPDYEYVLRGADGRSALVNDRRLLASFIVSPTRLIEDWAASPIAGLEPAQLDALLALEPEVIILGTGDAQAFPPPRTMAACLARGVGLEAMTNGAAARTFNVLASEGRRVVAGFILSDD
ncbi:Mth938-like domain-containing protein [Luteimonas sp. MC1750]|uniref:Mth938-like domain-containing protein n=1 Tax=Luteimonas sp. MC1750 TaxID=2799326 RepID=UPI0018F0ACB1|nr:Mth938-like domain-containing protein [Luteimonas sp. MC1750]MBJ6983801.1 Mth938-like domain-containing protein [Luteimonas sp. MC1750]QQO06629.1 Mth938-like domain-containing protein [Luteimonas sp. MC1750]